MRLPAMTPCEWVLVEVLGDRDVGMMELSATFATGLPPRIATMKLLERLVRLLSDE
jgi:hypothetical protein